MATSGKRLIGISEVGHVESGPTDQSWGKTAKDGVEVQMSLSRVDLRSGQSKNRLESHATDVDFSLTIALIENALEQMGLALALASAKFAGDLTAGTPTAESLVVDGSLGTNELAIYAIGPGPASTRRLDAARCVLTNPGSIKMADNGFMDRTVAFDLLEPTSGDILKFTDAT